MRKFILLIFIFLTMILEAKELNLSPKDVKVKIDEILRSHASYKKINSSLAERILRNFLEELDPTKTYFIESDIQKWLYPTDEMINNVTEAIQNQNFTLFEEIHTVMLQAIERRNMLETELEGAAMPKDVKPEEFKEMNFTASKSELLQRLVRIKALQLDSAEKFNDEIIENFIKRLEKRRKSRENEIIGKNPKERKSLILSYLLKSFCHSLDSHTDYFTPFEADQFMMQVQQKLSGIGALLKDNLNGFTIMQVIEKSPAKAANLKIGDRIVAVNKEPVIGLDITDAVELIRGEKGSKIVLTLVREDQNKEFQKFDIELTRGEIVLEESRLETKTEPFADGVIAHFKLFSFYQDEKSSSAADLKNALENLKKNNKIKAVLLDLRSNTGGLLPQAVEVASLFLEKGIVVSIKDSAGNVQHLRNTDGKVTFDGPLLVFVNKASASASEIVAGTLQDYGRAIIVGDETTFGKGSFQTFTLDTSKNAKVNTSGEYKVTRGRYYTVSGNSPQLTGIKSDIVVPGILSELEIGEKFSKYPLENDKIAPNFEDDLSDIPPIHRKRISLLYKHNMQQKIANFTQYLDILKSNSQKRLEMNKNYQSFLKEIKNKNFEAESVEIFGQNDLQLIEAYNITKDLSYLIQVNDKDVD
ncbi:MAG: PDZ domain-containing protein [Parachlamydiales bacterium]|nr:PDZ domain-containing protein [Parachlamydiales bacterium]